MAPRKRKSIWNFLQDSAHLENVLHFLSACITLNNQAVNGSHVFQHLSNKKNLKSSLLIHTSSYIEQRMPAYLSLYVDDMLTLGSDNLSRKNFKLSFGRDFDKIDLGSVSFVLSLEIKLAEKWYSTLSTILQKEIFFPV